MNEITSEFQDNRDLLNLILWKKLRKNTDTKEGCPNREALLTLIEAPLYSNFYHPIFRMMNEFLETKI